MTNRALSVEPSCLSAAVSFAEPLAGNGLFEHFSGQIAKVAALRANMNAGNVAAVAGNHAAALVVHHAPSDVDLLRGTLRRLKAVK